MINTLYRKYRPKILKEVIGQEHITSTLIYSIKNNKTHQAYIFSGIRGTGKTTLAKIIARAINCLNFNDDLCLKCQNCINSEFSNIDIIELDAASNNGISEIRNIIENISYMPQSLSKKIYIIDETHMLTNSAWNALLKTIEEPPKHIYFIFATTEFHKIPLTILSRCQHFKLNRLSEHEIIKIIDHVCTLEKIKIDEDSKKKVFRLSNGSARDALTILEQLAIYSKNNITLDTINELYGYIDNKIIISFIENLFLNKTLEVWKQIEIFKSKTDASLFIEQLINILIDIKLYNETSDYKILDCLYESDTKLINNHFENNKVIKLLEGLYDLNKNSVSNDHKFFNLKTLLAIFNNNVNNNNNLELNDLKQENYQTNHKNKEFIIDKLFNTKEKVINNDENTNKLNLEISNGHISLKEIFTKIAHFSDPKEITKLNEILRTIRQNNNYEEILKILSLSNRFFIVSHGFAILLFEEKDDALKFNKLFHKLENKEIIINYFPKNLLIHALSFIEAKEFNDYAKKVNKKHVKEITYDEINQYLEQLKEDLIKESILKLI